MSGPLEGLFRASLTREDGRTVLRGLRHPPSGGFLFRSSSTMCSSFFPPEDIYDPTILVADYDEIINNKNTCLVIISFHFIFILFSRQRILRYSVEVM